MWNVRNGFPVAVATVSTVTKRASLPWQEQRPSLLGCLSALNCSSCRALHFSSPFCKSKHLLLRKFIFKKKKKFWYSSPVISSYLPSNLASGLNLAPPKAKKEDSIRKRALNVLLFNAVRDLLSTPEAGQELYDLNVELFKASLTSDFSTCRIYWRSSGNAEKDEHIQKVLQRSASYIRHLLISYQVLGNIPSIIFIRDKEEAAIREIEKLLATADFGPEEEENELIQNDFSEEISTMADKRLDSSTHMNLFGIDHAALNKQIVEYKKMTKCKAIEGTELLQQQRLQLTEIKQQHKKMKWKKSKKSFYDDSTPENYLRDKYSEDNWDSEVSSSEEDELEYKSKRDDSEVEIKKIK